MNLSLLRWIGRLEGISFLLLLCIAMPLKYAMGMPEAVRVVGMAHGILFILYVGAANYAAIAVPWPKRMWFLSLVASVLPLGTFIFERRYLHPSAERIAS